MVSDGKKHRDGVFRWTRRLGCGCGAVFLVLLLIVAIIIVVDSIPSERHDMPASAWQGPPLLVTLRENNSGIHNEIADIRLLKDGVLTPLALVPTDGEEFTAVPVDGGFVVVTGRALRTYNWEGKLQEKRDFPGFDGVKSAVIEGFGYAVTSIPHTREDKNGWWVDYAFIGRRGDIHIVSISGNSSAVAFCGDKRYIATTVLSKDDALPNEIAVYELSHDWVIGEPLFKSGIPGTIDSEAGVTVFTDLIVHLMGCGPGESLVALIDAPETDPTEFWENRENISVTIDIANKTASYAPPPAKLLEFSKGQFSRGKTRMEGVSSEGKMLDYDFVSGKFESPWSAEIIPDGNNYVYSITPEMVVVAPWYDPNDPDMLPFTAYDRKTGRMLTRVEIKSDNSLRQSVQEIEIIPPGSGI